MSRPILFLDVDGVLNRSATAYGRMQAVLVQRLHDLVIATGCEIVVSSGWRLGGIERGSDFYRHLERIPGGETILSRVIGRTGSSDLGRAVEILSWLEKERPGAHFAAVDDMDMSEQLGDRLVLCRSDEGLTEERAEALRVALTRRSA
ncbi:MAG TPA: HAD domain-containing protein [Polyangiaceae bacterium]